LNESERAQAYLTDEFFMGVVEKQRLLYISNILDSRDEDIDVRERERLKLKGLEEFIASLKSMSMQKEIDKKRWKVF
jgi:NDP-sugar pyrophosphorylase family protein